MRKFKMVLLAVIAALLVLLYFTNQEYFQSKHTLGINFMVVDEIKFPQASNVVIFLICFFLGVLIAYFFNLMERFRSRKTVKELNNTINAHRELLSSMKTELETFKKEPVKAGPEVEIPTAEAAGA